MAEDNSFGEAFEVTDITVLPIDIDKDEQKLISETIADGRHYLFTWSVYSGAPVNTYLLGP